MKKTLFIVAAFLCLLNTNAQEFSTKLETIFTSEKESARLQHVKSSIDSKGKLHLVFTGYEKQPYYATNQSGSWKFEKLSYLDKDYNETYNVAYFPNIAIDKSDNIHIVMFDKYKEKALYAKKTIAANTFNFEVIKSSPQPLRFGVYGEYTDMAIDGNDGLHLLCQADYTDKNEKKYNQAAIYLNKPSNSGNWVLQVLVHDSKFDDRNWFFGNNSSITCYNDKVYAAISGSNDLHFGSRSITGGKWDIEKLLHTPDKFINSGKDMLSLAISPSGAIKFAYFDRTDNEKSPYHGLTIISKNCDKKRWLANSSFDEANAKNRPAIAFDKEGKTYLAIGRNELILYHQTCDCSQEYKQIFKDTKKRSDFVDMIVDNQNVVHAFFTSVDDNNLYYLTAKQTGTAKNCNYRPIFHVLGKTSIKPNEEWTAKVVASDPECDPIKISVSQLPDGFKLVDNGNGTATISGKTSKTSGEISFTVFCNDDKHLGTDGQGKASIKLKINAKGSKTYSNNCMGKKKHLMKVDAKSGATDTH